jgi:hypothetical protein
MLSTHGLGLDGNEEAIFASGACPGPSLTGERANSFLV